MFKLWNYCYGAAGTISPVALSEPGADAAVVVVTELPGATTPVADAAVVLPGVTVEVEVPPGPVPEPLLVLLPG